MTILTFDRNYNFLDAAWDQIDVSAQQVGATPKVAHDLMTQTVIAKSAGYAFVFVSNESPTLVDAYFDDFKITLGKSAVVQGDDYYPFGLTFNSYQRENSLKSKYQYNGKELQTDLGLDWLDYGARMYMPDIGKWGVIDPMNEKYFSLSGYNYTMNDPILYVDPDGMEVEFASGTSKKDKREFMRRQRKLNRGSKTASKQWRALNKKNGIIHTIHINETQVTKKGETVNIQSHVKAKSETDRTKGTDLFIDLNEKTDDGAPQMVIIGHEEAHALDNETGAVDHVEAALSLKNSPEENLNAVLAAQFENSKRDETSASHTENKIRGELDPKGKNIPLRATYNISRDKMKNGQLTTEQVPINVIKDGYRYYKHR